VNPCILKFDTSLSEQSALQERKRGAGSHLTEGCVGPKGILEKRTICPCQDSKHDSSDIHPAACSLIFVADRQNTVLKAEIQAMDIWISVEVNTIIK
jgi:hypothetical protein